MNMVMYDSPTSLNSSETSLARALLNYLSNELFLAKFVDTQETLCHCTFREIYSQKCPFLLEICSFYHFHCFGS